MLTIKLNELRGILDGEKLDFALFYNADSVKVNPNFQYFSGYTGMGVLVIPKERQPFLIAPQMEFERAKKSSIKRVYSMDKKKFFESSYNIIKKIGIRHNKIAIDNTNFNLNSYRYFKKQFKGAKTKDLSIECLRLREKKTPKEIEYLRKSCGFADKIIQKAINNFKKFKTESEVAAFLEYETKKQGLELSFNPIVASGQNGSMPHYQPKNVPLKKGFCVIDFGVKYNGYCSDITRTIYLGKPSNHEKSAYNLLLRIQKDAIKLVKGKTKCSDMYDFVVKELGQYSDKFTHGLGHGVGIEIHELPNLTLNSKDKISENMVFTIEPGIYFPSKFGIRIEDTILFKNSPEPLTKTSKDLLILG